MLDLLVKRGFVVDGTGNPGFIADVAVKSGRIVDIGSIDTSAIKTVDARGQFVTPGFIDAHTHEELNILIEPVLERYLRQGVTTVINGQCGTSIADNSSDTIAYHRQSDNPMIDKVVDRWDSLEAYKTVAEGKGLGFNHGLLLGHGTLRWLVMGSASLDAPSPSQMDEMKAILTRGMEQGALGMSSGLDYVPSRAATTDEIVELCKVVAKFDGTYATHIRKAIAFGRSDGVAEAIQIGRRAGVRVQVSHLTYANDEGVAWMEKARQEGVEIACDVMPHSGGHVMRLDRFASSVKSSSFEYFNMDMDEFYALLSDEEARSRMVREYGQLRLPAREVILVNCKNRNYEGRSIADMAELAGQSIEDTLMDLLANEEPEASLWMYANRRNKSNTDKFPVIPSVATSPIVCCGSDSIMVDASDPFTHYELQRNGVFARFLEVGRELGTRLEYDIQRLTSLPAQQHRLKDRGLLKVGMAADILVFQPNNFSFPEELNPRDPFVVSRGMNYVVVNGEVVIQDSQLTAARPGQILMRQGVAYSH